MKVETHFLKNILKTLDYIKDAPLHKIILCCIFAKRITANEALHKNHGNWIHERCT